MLLSASDVSCGLFRCDTDRMSHARTCVIKLLNSSAELYRDFFSCHKANTFFLSKWKMENGKWRREASQFSGQKSLTISFQQLVMEEEKVSEKVTEATAKEHSSWNSFFFFYLRFSPVFIQLLSLERGQYMIMFLPLPSLVLWRLECCPSMVNKAWCQEQAVHKPLKIINEQRKKLISKS